MTDPQPMGAPGSGDRMRDSPPQDLVLARLAERLALELSDLAQRSLGLQAAMGRCRPCNPNDAEAIRGLQAIDRLSQHLADLAQVLSVAATEIPATLRIPAGGVLAAPRLREVAVALDTSRVDGEVPPASGDICWF